jgi:hypothetical protein
MPDLTNEEYARLAEKWTKNLIEATFFSGTLYLIGLHHHYIWYSWLSGYTKEFR